MTTATIATYCNHSRKHNSNHLSVHQRIRSAIRESQQPTSPIGFLFLNLPPPPCAVLLVHISLTTQYTNTTYYVCLHRHLHELSESWGRNRLYMSLRVYFIPFQHSLYIDIRAYTYPYIHISYIYIYTRIFLCSYVYIHIYVYIYCNILYYIILNYIIIYYITLHYITLYYIINFLCTIAMNSHYQFYHI